MIGFAIAATILAVFSQSIATWGTGWGVRLGMLAGTLSGLVLSQWTRKTSDSDRRNLFWLATVMLLWPSWLAVQLQLLQLLPTDWWQNAGLAELIGVIGGLLGWTIPVAVWAQLLLPLSNIQKNSGSLRVRWGACGCGLLLAAYVLVPIVGVVGLMWGALILAAAAVTFASVEAVTPAASVPADTGFVTPAAGPWAGAWLLLAGLAGWQTVAVASLFSEVMPATLPQWLANIALFGIGCAWGLARNDSQSSALSTEPGRAARGLAVLGTTQLLLASCLIPICLWLNSRVTNPGLLEISRLSFMASLLVPLGYWTGYRIGSGRTQGLVVLLLGYAWGDVLSLKGFDPIESLWLATLPAGACALLCSWWTAPRFDARRIAGVACLAGIWGAMVATAGVRWPTAESTKLLYSTTAAIAARSGWESHLLTQLDQSHLITSQPGGQGRWTLWQAHGGTLQVRCQGVPVGMIATQPDWSPQYGPEIAATVWPLALVDQPARVLLLGVGSSASLQAALTFPVSQVVCSEVDEDLLALLNSQVFPRCGFNPYQDERCLALRQPAEWLLLPDAEQFDVIVAPSPSASLPNASANSTTEYYQRAARHLSAKGVFCQRFQTIDFGPTPLLTTVATLQQAFPEVACLEVGAGEFLLLAAHDAEALVKADLPQRLERPHVMHLLSRCQWDWCTPLNFPAYDRAALMEAITEAEIQPLSCANSWLAFFTPRELLRWGPKQQEIAAVLQQARTSASVYPLARAGEPPRALSTTVTSRRSRYLDWIGHSAAEATVLRRLGEVVSQRELVRQFPDTYWWEYRKELREQLQDRPRTGLQMVSHTVGSGSSRWHPEDQRRKAYFVLLGEALKADVPDRNTLMEIELLLEPYDPLLTYFAHQELADLYGKGDQDPAIELAHRLHVIYYAPPEDASVRNVIAAIDHLVEHPDAVADDAERFERLNGLLQVLRSRWEVRNTRPSKSAKVTLQEIERSLVTVERALEVMQPLSSAAGYSATEWETRQLVLERLLVRPFRSYRDQLVLHTKESRRKTLDLLQKANELKESDKTSTSLNSP